MAPRWIHEFFDILTFGRSYWQIHKRIDQYPKTLGVKHRELEHPFYNMLKNHDSNDFLKSVPQLLSGLKSVEESVKLVHCIVDKVWDELSLEQRKRSVYVFQRLVLEGKANCKTPYLEDYQRLIGYLKKKTVEELL
jgi:hypothetical protein